MGDAPTHRDDREARGDRATVPAAAAANNAAAIGTSAIGEQVGESVGPYRLLSLLGEGGFGVVFLAERREPIVQRVALKIIKPGMDSRQVIARFEQERQALAVMDHPNVARVLDAGATSGGASGGDGGRSGGGGGRPYFVMEYVAGEPITTFCDRHNLTIRQRLELFIPVCEAVQHAHTKGIIHRDIKPSNVLVSSKDKEGTPVPKVIDFGVAKAISHTLTDKTIFTEHGQIIGTPEYMSPEQAEMGALDIDTRTDVYSLGVVLYELLSGALPFDAEDLRSKGYAEIQRIIREVDPPRPSTKLTSMGEAARGAALHRQAKVDELTRELRNELEWIPLKAMRKDRAERYATPKDLADDVGRYLANEVVHARPPSAGYRLRKMVHRNRGAVIAAALVAAALIVATAMSLGFAVSETQQRKRADGNAQAAKASAAELESTMRFLESTLSLAKQRGHSPRLNLTYREVLDEAANEVEHELARRPDAARRIRTILARAFLGIAQWEAAAKQSQLAIDLLDLPKATNSREYIDLQSMHMLARVKLAGDDEAEQSDARRLLASASSILRGDDPILDLINESILETRVNQGLATEAAASIPLDELPNAAGIARLSPERLAAVANQAYAMYLAGNAPDAAPLLRSVVAANRGKLTDSHPGTIASMDQLAQVLGDLGEIEEARRLHETLLPNASRVLGADHDTTLIYRNNFATTLLSAGEFDAAATILQELLDVRTQKDGTDHPDRLAVLHNLGVAWQSMDDYERAERAFREAFDRRTIALSSAHPDALASGTMLAGALVSLKRAEEAEPLLREILRTKIETLGPDKPNTLVTMNELARALDRLGQADESLQLFAGAAAASVRASGADSPAAIIACYNHGEILQKYERFEQAEPILREAVGRASAAFGEDHPSLAWMRFRLGYCLAKLGRFDEAEPLMLQAFSTYERALPDDRASTAAIAIAIVALYEATARTDDVSLWNARIHRLKGVETPPASQPS